jgi:hypothetical protein
MSRLCKYVSRSASVWRQTGWEIPSSGCSAVLLELLALDVIMEEAAEAELTPFEEDATADIDDIDVSCSFTSTLDFLTIWREFDPPAPAHTLAKVSSSEQKAISLVYKARNK